MTSASIHTIDDLCAVRECPDTYSEIIIDACSLKNRGLLRHAFKYAAWGLRKGGRILVHDEPSVSLLYSPKRIDFWQVRREFFKSVGRYFDIVSVDDKAGSIEATKRCRTTRPNGISFCIVYGGGERDTQQLLEAIESLVVSVENLSGKVELLICGSVDESVRARIESLMLVAGKTSNISVRYIPYSGEVRAGRIPIADKKNAVFRAANYDAVVLSHTRISFSPAFVSRLLASCFDVLAPVVTVNYAEREYRFLDYILIGGYDLSKRNPASALGGYSSLGNPLYGMKKRVPYVDGGVMIFNRQVVLQPPFDPALSWGEAEDVDACATLYQQGLLIDLDQSLRCKSSVVKFSPVPSYWFRFTWPLKRLLVTIGVY